MTAATIPSSSSADGDLAVFLGHLIAGRSSGRANARQKIKVLLPISAGTGRHEIQRKLRLYYGVDWSLDRLGDVIDRLAGLELVRRGDFGLRLKSWERAIEVAQKLGVQVKKGARA